MTYSALSHLECPRCGARHDADLVQGTCTCGSPLLARYDLDRAGVSPDDLGARNWRGHLVAKAATNAVVNRWQDGPDTPDGVRARLRPGDETGVGEQIRLTCIRR